MQYLGFRGHLADSADTLFDYLSASEKAEKLLERIYIYANQASHVDMSNSIYQGFAARANSFMATFNSKTAFFTPEILASDKATILGYLDSKPELSVYQTLFNRIFREKAHTLSKNEETLLANVNELASSPMDIYSLFTNADLTFEQIHDDLGNLTDLTSSRFVPFLNSTDRNVRKEAFMSMYKSFGQFKNTLAATYSANAKKATFFANARKYESSLAAALEPKAIPLSVYDNLIETVHKHLSKMYKYVSLRKKALGLDELHMYDVYVPMIEGVDKKVRLSLTYMPDIRYL
jgi:oligoendopeptidase F